MSVYVVILAVPIALALWAARRHWREIAGLWREAAWWERGVLLVALAPIPGPFEEMAGIVVARRVASRRVPRARRFEARARDSR